MSSDCGRGQICSHVLLPSQCGWNPTRFSGFRALMPSVLPRSPQGRRPYGSHVPDQEHRPRHETRTQHGSQDWNRSRVPALRHGTRCPQTVGQRPTGTPRPFKGAHEASTVFPRRPHAVCLSYAPCRHAQLHLPAFTAGEDIIAVRRWGLLCVQNVFRCEGSYAKCCQTE